MRKIVTIFIVALVIFVAGCTTPGAPPQGGKQPGDNNQAPSGQPSGNQSSVQPSGGSDTPSAGTTDLNECLTSCNTFVDNDLVITCRAGCYMGVATETKDASKCENILTLGQNTTIYYDTCMINVATDIKNPALCTKIKEDAYRYTCISSIAEANLDVSLCDQIEEGIYKYGCISTVAGKKKDPSMCDRITEEYMKQSCVDGTK